MGQIFIGFTRSDITTELHKTIIRLEAEGRPACAGLFLFKAYVGFVCCYLSDGFRASLAEGAGLLLALALLGLGELLLQVFHLLTQGSVLLHQSGDDFVG